MSNQPVVTTSSTTEVAPRPVSLITTLFILALFAAFFFVVRYFYTPGTSAAHAGTLENISDDTKWRASSATRRETLKTHRDEHAKQVSSYGWVDQKAGVVRLPIEQAMELTAKQYGGKGQAPQPKR